MCTAPHAHHDRHRRRQAERARIGDNENAAAATRPNASVAPARKRPKRRTPQTRPWRTLSAQFEANRPTEDLIGFHVQFAGVIC